MVEGVQQGPVLVETFFMVGELRGSFSAHMDQCAMTEEVETSDGNGNNNDDFD